MADSNDKKSKPGGKTGELLLGVLGALGEIAGPLITGQSIDFGAPFKMGSQYLQNERMNEDLQKALGSNPHTADIANEVQGVIDQGGIPGLMGQGDTPNLDQVGQPLQHPDSNVAQPQQPTMEDEEYYKSPEFLQELTRLGRGDIAEKILTSRASQKSADPMSSILKSLQLRDYMSPQEKIAAKTTRDQELDEMYRNRSDDRMEEQARIGREKWKVGEEKALVDGREAISSLSFSIDQLNAGVEQNVLSAVMGKSPVSARIGLALGNYTEPQLQQMRDIKKMVMKAVKTQSGVQYGFRELQWIKSALPNEWDSPEMLNRGMTMLYNNTLWNQYDRIMNKAHKSGNAEVASREGMSPEQMKAYQILKAQLTKRATNNKSELAIFADPKNAKLFEYLNMRLLDSTDLKLKGK